MRVSKLRIHDTSHAALRACGKVSLLTIKISSTGNSIYLYHSIDLFQLRCNFFFMLNWSSVMCWKREAPGKKKYMRKNLNLP